MRLALIIVAACSAAPAKPPAPPAPVPDAAVGQGPAVEPIAKPRYRIAVLGIEPMDPGVLGAARTVTDELRTIARDDPAAQPTGSTAELVDEKLVGGCTDEAPTCMAAIGHALGADVVVYGHLAAGYALDLRAVHVASHIVHTWSGATTATDAGQRATARTAYAAVVGRVE